MNTDLDSAMGAAASRFVLRSALVAVAAAILVAARSKSGAAEPTSASAAS
jgi:hypothetical protein